MLIIEISVKLKDQKNTNIQVHLPISAVSHLKLKKHIPFLEPKKCLFPQSLLSSLNEKSNGILIEVETYEANIKVEVKEYETTNSL